MGTRSLQASPKGIEKAKIALAQYSLSQNALAEDLGLSRQTVNNFFKGKPIDRENFALICERLGLDIGNTVAIEASESETSKSIGSSELDALVQDVRQKVHANIQKRCGTMRALDMEQPISIDSIYTKVNILEKISRNQRRTIAELLEGCDLEGEEGFNRFSLGHVRQRRIPGLEAVQLHDKLLVLGKPGSGKTTFLKWLAIQCTEGQLHSSRVPIFVTLKEFAEHSEQPNLRSFINSQFKFCKIDNAEEITETLLQEGRLLVLLDGLDEVRNGDHDRVLQEICSVSTQFDTNRFVITCRIAAQEYTFQPFTEVEIADFDDIQIAEFSHKWFQGKGSVRAEQFSKELATYQPLKELATNPLLLTLLCLIFEEQVRFPANRAELYKEGFDILLKKWDAKRNVKRDEVYKDLSLKQKENLLSQIAFTTFEKSEYFFKQKTVEQKIEQFICNLPNASIASEALQLDSEAVLKSIEAQHGLLVERARGIYSFSHLTFHEYFTARWIGKHDELYPVLISHLTEKRWQEVFLLMVGMLEDADPLLLMMKSQIDKLLTTDDKLQQFLAWVQQKSCSVNTSYKLATLRAFYFARGFALSRNIDLTLEIDRDLAFAIEVGGNIDYETDCIIDHAIDRNRPLASALSPNFSIYSTSDLSIDCALTRAQALARARARATHLRPDRNIDTASVIARALETTRDLVHDTVLQQSLEKLKNQLPTLKESLDDLLQWWLSNGWTWIEELITMTIKHRNIGHNWGFSDAQQETLRQYYNANKLLVDCLNSDCYVSREVREEIERSLLLPLNSQQ